MARETTISPSAAGVSVLNSESGAIDVTRLRVAIARLSRRLRRHELAGLTPTQLAALATVERLRAEGTALLTQSLMLLTPEQRAALAAALPALEQLADPDPRGPARPLEQQGG